MADHGRRLLRHRTGGGVVNILWLVAIVAIILGGIALALHLERLDIRREARRGGDL